MAKLNFLSLLLIFNIISLRSLANPNSGCGGPCDHNLDCYHRLTCNADKKCFDNPRLGTHTCDEFTYPCEPFGSVHCEPYDYPLFKCSPPIKPHTEAQLTLKYYGLGESNVGSCNLKYDVKEKVVTLSTGWYTGGSLCGKHIKIEAQNGKDALAKVVGECDSTKGCEGEHGREPCDSNVIDGSDGVWDELKLNKKDGLVDVTWSLVD